HVSLRPSSSRATRTTSTWSQGWPWRAALGVPLLRGRNFDERDATDAPLAVIINASLAHLHWPNDGPLGARLKLGPPGDTACSHTPWRNARPRSASAWPSARSGVASSVGSARRALARGAGQSRRCAAGGLTT